MLKIRVQSTFKKDFKRIVKRGYNIKLLENILSLLAKQEPLPEKYHDHNLSGDYAQCRACHISPDWVLFYEINDEELSLLLIRTGTHSDLF